MMIELLMHLWGFDAVWYAHPGSLSLAIKNGRWHVGLWTGPHGDLVCVRHCDSRTEAEKHLSPGSRTVMSALIKAIYLRRRRMS